MKKKANKLARKKHMKSRSPWRSLTRTVNELTRISKKRKGSMSYLEKAEMTRLKRSIGKLKDDLKEAQKTNLDLVHIIEDLEAQLSTAAEQLARVSDALKEISTSLKPTETTRDK